MSEPSPKEKRHVDEGIDQLERYRAAKEVLEEQEQRGKAYVEKVRHDVEQDLAPLRQEVEDARRSIEAYVREENGGEKFRVPGLGTAYLMNRRQTRIVDQEKFLDSAHDYFGGLPDGFYEQRLVPASLKRAAEGALDEDGVLLGGVESEEVQSLTVRLGK